PSIDLAPYAGMTIQIDFYFESHDVICCGNDDTGPGWYIDEVAVVTGAVTLANPEDFELGLGDWSVDNGTWEVGVPSSGPRAAHSGGQCAATVLAGNYGENVTTRLVSPAFEVPAANQSPRLRFWHWFSFGAGDFGTVQIKDGTNGWVNLSGSYGPH